jgi:hypothetical protein
MEKITVLKQMYMPSAKSASEIGCVNKPLEGSSEKANQHKVLKKII